MTKRIALLITLVLAIASLSFAHDHGSAPKKSKLTKVEPKTVCMMNEHAMGKDQIAVDVEGKTYYGCCEMCKKALAENADKRVAVDPVSGKKVDKAVAVIGAQEDGKVFYFENDENLKKYNESVK